MKRCLKMFSWLLLVLFFGTRAMADEVPSLVVTTHQDIVNAQDNQISLREALLYCTAYPQLGSHITFHLPSGSPTTVVLSQQLVIDSNTVRSIDGTNLGPDGGIVTLDADQSCRHFFLDNNSTTSLSHMILQNGRSPVSSNYDQGGGSIYVKYAHLHLNSVLLKNNSAGSHNGGAIYVVNTQPTDTAYVELDNVRFSNNSAFEGGALYIDGHLFFSHTIDHATFDGNTAANVGGAIFLNACEGDAEVIVNNTTFLANSANQASAINIAFSQLSLMNSTVVDNWIVASPAQGAAIRTESASRLAVINSLLTGNHTNGPTGAMGHDLGKNANNSAAHISLYHTAFNSASNATSVIQSQSGFLPADCFVIRSNHIKRDSVQRDGITHLGCKLKSDASDILLYQGLPGGTVAASNRHARSATRVNGQLRQGIDNTPVAASQALFFSVTPNDQWGYNRLQEQSLNRYTRGALVNRWRRQFDTITVCSEYVSRVSGQHFTQSGDYCDTLWAQTPSAYDTIFHYHLTVQGVQQGYDTLTACDGINWYGRRIVNSGNYTELVAGVTSIGCDSLYHLSLTIHRSTTGIEYDTACGSYLWMGQEYSSSGILSQLLPNANRWGCDSTEVLMLTIHQASQSDSVLVTCDSAWVNGTWITSSQTLPLTSHFTNAEGCDSSVVLHLQVMPSSHLVFADTVCDSYRWHDQTYLADGTYTYSYANADGCASTDTLRLALKHSSSGIDVQSACDDYLWMDGNHYTSSNSTAVFSIPNSQGCDSVVTLSLTIRNSNSGLQLQTACDSFYWNGIPYYSTPTFAPLDTLTNQVGCDSVVSLQLTILSSSSGQGTRQACDSLWLQDRYYYASTLVEETGLTNAVGCDSSTHLRLVIYHGGHSFESRRSCDSLVWRGTAYTASGLYENLSLDAHGCTNHDTLDLTIRQSTSSTDTRVVCDSLLWMDGVTYVSNTSSATCRIANAGGCDSLVTLSLTVLASSHVDTLAAACDYFDWRGLRYTRVPATPPTSVTVNAEGCDSVTTLRLTLNASAVTHLNLSGCDSVATDQTTYLTSGDYCIAGQFLTLQGCDSTIYHHVSILPSQQVTVNHTVNENDLPYFYNGQSFVRDTMGARFHFTNQHGCDSLVIFNLYVNWNGYTRLDSTVCADQLPLTWHTRVFTSDGVQYDTLTTRNGADSILTLNLHVNPVYSHTLSQRICQGDTYSWNQTDYISTGNYSAQLLSVHECDSSVTLNLSVQPLGYGVELVKICDSLTWVNGVTYKNSTSGDTYTLDGASANGCDSIVSLDLYILQSTSSTHNVTVNENDLPFRYLGQTFYDDTLGAQLVMPNSVKCDSLITLNLHVNHNVSSTLDSTICDSQLPLRWNHRTFMSSGTLYDTLTTALGTDSLVQMNLTVHSSYSLNIADTICAGRSYLWNETEYSSSGIYVQDFTSTEGCDSTVALSLVVRPTAKGTDNLQVCDSLIWIDGETYYADASRATCLLPNASVLGCDSLVALFLRVHYSSSDTRNISVNENDLPFHFLGQTFSSDTMGALFHLTNHAGCDSTVTLNLTVNRNRRLVLDSTICSNELPLVWNHRTFTQAGTQFDTLVAQSGADSLLVLNLHVNSVFSQTDQVSVCDNEYYIWQDDTLFAPGTYVDSLITQQGCDSLLSLRLTHLRTTYGTDALFACDSLNWIDDQTYYASTSGIVHLMPHGNANGCDTIVRLDLKIGFSSSSVVFDTVNENDLPYHYHGYTFTSDTNNVSLHLVNQQGCDSSVTYNLHVNRNGHSVLDSTICANLLPFSWNNRLFTRAGTQFDTLQTSLGTDSLLTLNLHVANTYRLRIFDTICQGTPYTFGGNDLDRTGLFRHHFTTSQGCDSLVNLNLLVLPVTSNVNYLTACDSFTWYNGSTYYVNTFNIYDTLSGANQWGCDSVNVLNLKVHYSSFDSLSVVINENDLPYNYNGLFLYTDTVGAEYLLTNHMGCDSTVVIDLMVYTNSHASFDSTVCSNQLPLQWHHRTFTAAGTLYDTLSSYLGTDSLLTLTLHVLPSYADTLFDTLCAPAQYLWRDSAYSDSGLYTFSYVTQQGCDSVHTLALTVHQPTDSLYHLTVCDSVLWHQAYYTLSGSYTHAYLSPQGCPSVDTLELVVHTSSLGYDTLVACDSLTWINGINYTVSTSHPQHLLPAANQWGCDSLVQLSLTVNHSTASDLYQSACDSFYWTDAGQTYQQSCDTSALLSNRLGCDSLITLHLTVHQTLRRSEFHRACGYFIWAENHQRYDTSAIDSVILTSQHGCDSVIVLNLLIENPVRIDTVVTACDSFYWEVTQQTYRQSFVDSLQLFTTFGCDSLLTLYLTINNSRDTQLYYTVCDSLYFQPTATCYRSDTTISVPLIASSGCDSLVLLDLTVHHAVQTQLSDTICQYGIYHFHGQACTETGLYSFDTLTSQGCDSLVLLSLSVVGPPAITFSVEPQCVDSLILVTAHTPAPYLYWTSTADQPDLGRDSVIGVNPLQPTLYKVVADYKPFRFCPATDSVLVNPLLYPSAALEVKPPYITPEQLDFQVFNLGTHYETYQWLVDGQEVFADEASMSYTADVLTDSLWVQLVVSTQTCTDTASYLMHQYRQALFVPNTFTPSVENNNRFRVLGDDFIEFHIDIYSRQGLLVYSADDPHQGWDGTHQGVPCPQAAYVYTIRYRTQFMPTAYQTKTGSVLLIR